MGMYDGGQVFVDSFMWVWLSSSKGGELYLVLVLMWCNEEIGLMEWVLMFDLYVNGGNGYILCNFGYGGGW